MHTRTSDMGRMFNHFVYSLRLYLYMTETVGAVIPAPTNHLLHTYDNYNDVG